MKYAFLGVMFFLLSGCFSGEPSEDEMEEAFTKSALPYAKNLLLQVQEYLQWA